MKLSKILSWLLETTATLKMYHWQTRLLSRHLAIDELLKAWAPLTDQLAEALLGLEPRLKKPRVLLKVPLLDDNNAEETLFIYRQWLQSLSSPLSKHSELLSIRDDLLVALDQTIYRFTLR
jgi:DNA-binding ferritin-like protein